MARIPLVGVVLFGLSLPVAGQVKSVLRLQTESRDLPGTPVIDAAGETIAWRERERVIWQNQHGSTLFAQPGRSLKQALSAHGEMLAVLQASADHTLELAWYDQHGNRRGHYLLARHEDDPLPQICLNDAGTAVLLAQPASAELIFLSGGGTVSATHTLFEAAAYSNERPLFVAAGAQEFFVLSQLQTAAGASEPLPVLFCFSFSGELKWHRELPAGMAGGLVVADNSEWLVAGRYRVEEATGTVESSIILLSRDGNPSASTTGLFRKAVFAGNGERVLLMDRRQVRLLKLPDLDTIWQSSLSSRNEMFVDIAMAPSGRDHFFALAAVSAFKDNRFVFERGRLIKFSLNGHQLTAARLPHDLINPALALSPVTQRLLLAAEGLLQRYTVVSVVQTPAKRAIKH